MCPVHLAEQGPHTQLPGARPYWGASPAFGPIADKIRALSPGSQALTTITTTTSTARARASFPDASLRPAAAAAAAGVHSRAGAGSPLLTDEDREAAEVAVPPARARPSSGLCTDSRSRCLGLRGLPLPKQRAVSGVTGAGGPERKRPPSRGPGGAAAPAVYGTLPVPDLCGSLRVCQGRDGRSSWQQPWRKAVSDLQARGGWHYVLFGVLSPNHVISFSRAETVISSFPVSSVTPSMSATREAGSRWLEEPMEGKSEAVTEMTGRRKLRRAGRTLLRDLDPRERRAAAFPPRPAVWILRGDFPVSASFFPQQGAL